MSSEPKGQPEFHRGSCVCLDIELRITERCLVEDLQLPPDMCFKEAVRQPIVKAFVAKRSQVPVSGKTVGPKRGERTLYHLGVGNTHRGATWHDTAHQVVWLCGYGFHRSGEPRDAFQSFKRLLQDDRMHPAEADYRRLIVDRQWRFIETAPGHAAAVRQAAMSHPGTIQAGSLGHRVPVRIVLNVSPGIADLTVAFSPAGLNQREIVFIVRCFALDPGAELTDVSDTLGGMPLVPGEIAFQIITPA